MKMKIIFVNNKTIAVKDTLVKRDPVENKKKTEAEFIIS